MTPEEEETGAGISLPSPRSLNKSLNAGLAASLMAAAVEEQETEVKPACNARTPRRQVLGRLPGLRATGKAKLRDLDPHLELSDTMPPSQHLHGNWPDGLKRQVARHFYGMTPEQIRGEEEKERLRHHKQRTATKESGNEDVADGAAGEQGAAAGAADGASPASPRNNRRKAPVRGPAIRGPDVLPHGLEVRIRNGDNQHGRAVVGRHTARIRGHGECTARPTMMLGQIHAEAGRRFETAE